VKFASCLLLLVSLGAVAQENRVTGLPPNSIAVGADGDFDSAPDTAVISFALSAQEKTSQAAFESASRLAEQMRQALHNAGVDPKTAELSRYSLYPVFDYRNPKQKVIAYRVGTNVTIKLRDFARIGSVTEALAGLEGTTGQTMSYDLEEIDAAKQKAIGKAYERAHGYAETLAKASGKQLGAMISATMDVQQAIPVMPYGRIQMAYAKEANGNPTPAPTEDFQAQKIKVTARVNAVFSLQ